MKNLSILSGVLFVTALVACSTDDASSLHRNAATTGDAGDSQAGVIAPAGGSVRPPYEIKTSAEIASTIQSCFGDGVTTVAGTMIQTIANPAGFLSARQFVTGDDVVLGESIIIDGDPSVQRVGVRNATLSLSILASLQDIGNVVGENCASQVATNALCNCGTPDAAHAMLARCLPAIAPSQYAALEADFATSCSADPTTAIASLLASTAFGVQ